MCDDGTGECMVKHPAIWNIILRKKVRHEEIEDEPKD
jgi:hypothetical protein